MVCACLLLCGCPHTSPVQQALRFLEENQVRQPLITDREKDLTGNWPQYFYFRSTPQIRIREVSPFMVTFIHHALSLVTEENAGALGLTQDDVDVARAMRLRAVDFLLEFEADPEAPDAGTFAFWPYDTRNDTPSLAEEILADLLAGPVLGGSRSPLNLPVFPRALAIPSDADVTGTVYAALLDNMRLDGGPPVASPVRHFVDWRDTGTVPRRLNPAWLAPSSGAFLTWLSYGDAPDAPHASDVDAAVNATVLFALGEFGAPEAPGAAEAIALINGVVAQGLHETRLAEVSLYYPDNYAFHYFVSRAFYEGPMPGLAPAVEQLARELEQNAIRRGDGKTCWDRGAPQLNTAFAALTLMNAGRTGPIVDGAIAYLEAAQDPFTGGWDESVFFVGRLDGGQEARWASESFTTALALEAICRHRLAGADPF